MVVAQKGKSGDAIALTVVYLVVNRTEQNKIQEALEKAPPTAKVEFVPIPEDADFGTADTLRYIGDKIVADLVVVSCDTIADVDLLAMIDKFRLHEATLVSLLMRGGVEAEVTPPGPKSKEKLERDLILTNPDTSRLVYMASANDFTETVRLPGHFLRSNGRVDADSRLLDAHVYVMRKWLINFLRESPSFSTLKGEFLPYVIKKQMSRAQPPAESDRPPSDAGTDPLDIYAFADTPKYGSKIAETSLNNEERLKQVPELEKIRCYAWKAPRDAFGVRVNTLRAFWAVNKRVFALWPKWFPEGVAAGDGAELVSPGALIESTQMTQCAVGDKSRIAAKTSLKSSVIGAGCTVGTKSRISGSVLMDDVLIEEGVTLDNCIVCRSAVIRAGSVLKFCLIGANFVVAEGTQRDKANLTNSSDFRLEIE